MNDLYNKLSVTINTKNINEFAECISSGGSANHSKFSFDYNDSFEYVYENKEIAKRRTNQHDVPDYIMGMAKEATNELFAINKHKNANSAMKNFSVAEVYKEFKEEIINNHNNEAVHVRVETERSVSTITKERDNELILKDKKRKWFIIDNEMNEKKELKDKETVMEKEKQVEKAKVIKAQEEENIRKIEEEKARLELKEQQDLEAKVKVQLKEQQDLEEKTRILKRATRS